MQNVLDRLRPGARIAVIRLRSLGDCVLSTPALHLLKRHRPDVSIAVVVEDAFAPVFAGNPDLEAILPPSALAIAQWHPALCLNLHGGTRSAQLTVASRARFRAGFAHFRWRPLYNVPIPTAQRILGVSRTIHTAEHAASAMFHLGVPAAPIPRARLFVSPGPAEMDRPYAVIHPFASAPEKTWPTARFAALARFLRDDLDLDPIFIGGAGEGLDAFPGYRRVSGAPLDAVKRLLAGAALFAGNDSGPAHMAAAFGVPAAVLFGPSNPEIWAPWRTESVVLNGAAGDIGAIPLDAVTSACRALYAPVAAARASR